MTRELKIVSGFPKVYWTDNIYGSATGGHEQTYLAFLLVKKRALQEVDALVIEIDISKAFEVD